MGRERRRRSRRSTRTQPTAATPRVAAPETGAAPASDPARPWAHGHVQVRSDRVQAREAETMISEMKRVGLVSAVCFGMLAVLVVVERLQ